MEPYHEHNDTTSLSLVKPRTLSTPGHGAKAPQVLALPPAGAEQNEDAVQGLQIQL